MYRHVYFDFCFQLQITGNRNLYAKKTESLDFLKKSINFSFFQGPEDFLQTALEIRWSLKKSIQFQSKSYVVLGFFI